MFDAPATVDVIGLPVQADWRPMLGKVAAWGTPA